MSRRFDKWRASSGLLYGQVYGHFSIKLGKDSFDFKTVGFILCFYAVFAF